MMRRSHILQGIGVCSIIVIAAAFSGQAFRVIPAVLELEQRPGTVETYTLTVLNDTSNPEELQLYIGDWIRRADGTHDWDLPVNGARWTYDRAFSAGETVEIRYAITGGENLEVDGTYRTLNPQASGDTAGIGRIEPGSVGKSPDAPMDALIWVGRTVEAIDDGTATVRLTVRCGAAFRGLILYESLSQRAEIVSLENGAGSFETVNRSNAEWIRLSHDRLVLQPSESREVQVSVNVPLAVDGMYWSAIFVESQPRLEDRDGTRVLSVYRTAVKAYVTIPGTESISAEVTDVRVTASAPLTIEATVENRGNTQLSIVGAVQVIDRAGETVRTLRIPEFLVLPGAVGVVTIADPAEAPPLATGMYQAVAQFDFGGANAVVGVRGFRVR